MANPDVSIEAHIVTFCQALSDDLAGRIPVYLDFRFWMIVREVRSGIRTDPDIIVASISRLNDQITRLDCEIHKKPFPS